MANSQRAENQQRLWAQKFADAHGPRDLAAVEFGRVRADILDLPDRQQGPLWRELADWLADFHRRLVATAEGDVHDSRSRRG